MLLTGVQSRSIAGLALVPLPPNAPQPTNPSTQPTYPISSAIPTRLKLNQHPNYQQLSIHLLIYPYIHRRRRRRNGALRRIIRENVRGENSLACARCPELLPDRSEVYLCRSPRLAQLINLSRHNGCQGKQVSLKFG
jgi:hypothetical protein